MASFKYWVSFTQSFNARSHLEPFIHVCFIAMNVWPHEIIITLQFEISDFSLVMNARHSLLIASATSQSPIHYPMKSSAYIFLLCYTLCVTIWKKRYVTTLRKKVNEVCYCTKMNDTSNCESSRKDVLLYYLSSQFDLDFFNLNWMSKPING